MRNPKTPTREVLERLGPVQTFERSQTGEAKRLLLLKATTGAQSIHAIRTLIFFGASAVRAKQAVEAVMDGAEMSLTLPLVLADADVVKDLGDQGFIAKIAPSAEPSPVD